MVSLINSSKNDIYCSAGGRDCSCVISASEPLHGFFEIRCSHGWQVLPLSRIQDTNGNKCTFLKLIAMFPKNVLNAGFKVRMFADKFFGKNGQRWQLCMWSHLSKDSVHLQQQVLCRTLDSWVTSKSWSIEPSSKSRVENFKSEHSSKLRSKY